MKATGEVMAIDRSFEGALLKALRGLEVKSKDLTHARIALVSDEALENQLRKPDDERLWALAEAFRRGWTIDRVHDISRVDNWFLHKISGLVKDGHPELCGQVFKMVDTCAGEFESKTPYYYATVGSEHDSVGVASDSE
jgi:carbamoyl-phosphate synthase large subunit